MDGTDRLCRSTLRTKPRTNISKDDTRHRKVSSQKRISKFPLIAIRQFLHDLCYSQNPVGDSTIFRYIKYGKL